MRGLNAAGERGAVKIDIKFDLKLDRIKNQHLLLSGVARACTRQCLAVGVFIGRPRPPWYRGTAANLQPRRGRHETPPFAHCASAYTRHGSHLPVFVQPN